MFFCFRCPCRKSVIAYTHSPAASRNHATYMTAATRTHTHSPTIVSFDLESATGMKRAFDALPDEKTKNLPPKAS